MKTLVKLARFVGVVWSVAIPFWLMTEMIVRSLLFAANVGWIRTESTRPNDATNCEATVAGVEHLVQDAAAARDSTILGWNLGFETGGVRMATDVGLVVETGLKDEIDRTAQRLGVPVPAPPLVVRPSEREGGFVDYLRIDPQCIAAALARRHSVRLAEVYRFAAMMGYVYGKLMIMPTPIDGIETREFRAYGEPAGIPETLWKPLLEEAAAGAETRELAERVRRGIVEHVASEFAQGERE